MLPLTIYLLLHGIYMSLRIGGGGSFPKPLNEKEEREYLEKAATGDMSARNVLIERNLRLVVHVIKKYYTAGTDQEDLVSIGTIGLIKAVNTFDATKKIRLATYAGRCIENEILMHFRSLKKTAGEVSMSDELDGDGEGGTLILGDTIADASEEILDRISREELQASLAAGIQKELDGREREIIILRYGLDGKKPLTQREIAQRFGMSRSYVSRIEKKALGKLRKELEAGGVEL